MYASLCELLYMFMIRHCPIYKPNYPRALYLLACDTERQRWTRDTPWVEPGITSQGHSGLDLQGPWHTRAYPWGRPILAYSHLNPVATRHFYHVTSFTLHISGIYCIECLELRQKRLSHNCKNHQATQSVNIFLNLWSRVHFRHEYQK